MFHGKEKGNDKHLPKGEHSSENLSHKKFSKKRFVIQKIIRYLQPILLNYYLFKN
jgi:hypothetical protein